MRIPLVLSGRNRLQCSLDLERGFARCKARPIGGTKDGRVDRDRQFAESNVEHDVGGLAPDPGELPPIP